MVAGCGIGLAHLAKAGFMIVTVAGLALHVAGVGLLVTGAAISLRVAVAAANQAPLLLHAAGDVAHETQASARIDEWWVASREYGG